MVYSVPHSPHALDTYMPPALADRIAKAAVGVGAIATVLGIPQPSSGPATILATMAGPLVGCSVGATRKCGPATLVGQL